jgi:hypothetical protein
MSNRRLVTRFGAPAGERALIWHGDMSERVAHFEHRQDAEPLIEHVRTLRQISESAPVTDGPRLVAVVPETLYDIACAEGWVNDPDRWRKVLNDPALSKFRVTDEKL